MKNILLLCNFNSIFIKELVHHLKNNTTNFFILDISNNIYYDFQKKTKIQYVKNNIFIKIPIIKYLFLTFYAKNFINKKLNYKIDIAHILYKKIQYFFLINTIKRKIPKIIITIFGGDFYNEKTTMINNYIYKKTNIISFTNPETQKDFIKKYPNQKKNKLKTCIFGISHLDTIKKELYTKKNKKKLYKKFNIDKKTIVILCGSYGDPNEQHEKIIQELSKINKKYTNKITLIFPFTYGFFKNRTQKIQKICQQKIPTIKTIFLEKYLTDKEISQLRIITDILINIKKIDQFSAAMTETLFCKGIVIAGSWLPYKILDKNKINYFKISKISKLNKKIIYCINNLNKIKKQNTKNTKKIYNICSWKKNITAWKSLYYNQ